MVFVALTIGMIWVVMREYRNSASRKDIRAHFQQIAVALHTYHDQHGCFPPAYVIGPNGQRWHSWRVLLLPYLGEEELHRQYRMGEPWNSTHNLPLAAKIPKVYSCAITAGTDRGITTCLAVVGRATAWPEQYCARLEDIRDGTSNTIQLVECADSEILWIEPRDLSHQEAMRFDQTDSHPHPSSAHQKGGPLLALFGDGAVRSLSTQMSRDLYRSLLSINGGAPLAGVDWPLDEIPMAAELPAPQPASDFSLTDILPVPSGPVVAGRNYLYCATFAIAWDEACGRCGGRPLRLAGDPALAQMLNGHIFKRSNLSDESYIAAAGPGDDAFRKRLQAEATRKFPGSEPKLIDPDNRDHVLQLYAYLAKSLPLHVAFDVLPDPLEFQTADRRIPVASFGAEHLPDDSHGEQLRSQVTILDYVNDLDFILRIQPANPRDEIILAKIAPAPTLEEMLSIVRQRIEHPNPKHTDRHFLETESLVIPRLTVSVQRSYSEIVSAITIGTDLYVSVAEQIIKFRIDETGAVLESEAVIMVDNGHTPSMPAGTRKFIFDRPFLIYLIERGADQPYFAAWIENTEFMDRIGPKAVIH